MDHPPVIHGLVGLADVLDHPPVIQSTSLERRMVVWAQSAGSRKQKERTEKKLSTFLSAAGLLLLSLRPPAGSKPNPVRAVLYSLALIAMIFAVGVLASSADPHLQCRLLRAAAAGWGRHDRRRPHWHFTAPTFPHSSPTPGRR